MKLRKQKYLDERWKIALPRFLHICICHLDHPLPQWRVHRQNMCIKVLRCQRLYNRPIVHYSHHFSIANTLLFFRVGAMPTSPCPGNIFLQTLDELALQDELVMKFTCPGTSLEKENAIFYNRCLCLCCCCCCCCCCCWSSFLSFNQTFKVYILDYTWESLGIVHKFWEWHFTPSIFKNKKHHKDPIFNP